MKTRKWRPFIVVALIATGAGWLVGSVVKSVSTERFTAEKTEEAETLLALTSQFVSTYSETRKTHMRGDAPVPAEFRATAIAAFSDTPDISQNLSALMVGVPDRYIRTPPVDDAMASWLSSLSMSGDYTKSTEVIEVKGRPVLRSMFPSIASKQSCVECHNSIQVNRKQWKKGDLMGAFVIDRQIGEGVSEIGSLALTTGLLSTLLLCAVGFPLVLLRQRQSSSAELLAGSLDAIDDPFVVYDNQNQLVRHNRAFASLLPGSVDQLPFGMPGYEVLKLVGDDRSLKAQRDGETEDLSRQLPNGEIRWYKIAKRQLENGYTLELHSDITELKNREQELERSRNLLVEKERSARQTAIVAERANDAVVITDAYGKCVWVNYAFTKITGYKPDEVIGKKPGAFLQGPDTDMEVTREISDAVKRGERIRREILNYSKSGSPYWIEIDIVPVSDDDGALQNFIAIERDITEKKQFEEEIETARQRAEDASRSKSAFLANMSHEIRTPMNGVIGMAELLLESKLTDEQRTYAQTISQSGSSLLTIINDVLDFSKIEAGRLELDPVPFNLRSALEDVLALLASVTHAKGVEIMLDYPVDLPDGFMGDVGRLRQVVTNLVGNAAKFTLEGHVLVTVRGDVVGDKVAMTVDVSDTGIGIESAKLDKIFGEFEQVDAETNRQFEGTGLGLAISKRLIEMMGGELRVQSTLGSGSCFTLNVDLDVQDVENTQWDSAVCRNKHLLVIESEDIGRDILEKRLLDLGADVTVSATTRTALQWLEKKHDFDCVVLGTRAKKPSDGDRVEPQTLKSVRTAFNGPVILLSTAETNDQSQLADNDSRVHILAKPVRTLSILDTLRSEFQTDGATVNAVKKAAVVPASPQEQIRFDGDRVCRVLIAEDNKTNQLVITKMLKDAKLEIKVAQNGHEAVEFFRDFNPELVLMDISMPAMNGFEATAAIRSWEHAEGHERTPIVALTANAMRGDREKCLEAGMDDYLSKPVVKKALLETMHRWLASESTETTDA